MKRIVSISLGSSTRDHQVVTHFAGEEVSIKRIGTDGNVQVLRQHLQELDGKVDAFGLGGTDLYIYAGDKQYTFKESKKLLQIVKKTPIVDGSGLKNTLEEKVIYKNHFEMDRVLELMDFLKQFDLMESISFTCLWGR